MSCWIIDENNIYPSNSVYKHFIRFPPPALLKKEKKLKKNITKKHYRQYIFLCWKCWEVRIKYIKMGLHFNFLYILYFIFFFIWLQLCFFDVTWHWCTANGIFDLELKLLSLWRPSRYSLSIPKSYIKGKLYQEYFQFLAKKVLFQTTRATFHPFPFFSLFIILFSKSFNINNVKSLAFYLDSFIDVNFILYSLLFYLIHWSMCSKRVIFF